MLIYIVRHGETLANKDGLLQGWFDTPLSELGIDLAIKTGKGLKDIKFDACFSSPLKRAMDTARLILKENKNSIPTINKEERIKEIHLGSWEGCHFKGPLSTINEADINKFFTNPFLLKEIPEGETAKEVCKRTQDFINELVKKDYKNVLVTTHGFALRAMLNFIYEDQNDFWQGHVPYNCSVSILEFKNNKFTLLASDKIYYDNSSILDRYKL